MEHTYLDGISEGILIQRVKEGEKELFGQLYATHAAYLRQFVFRLVRSWTLVEDVVQQSFLKAFQHMAAFRAESSFRTWLVRIALNDVREYMRSSKRWATVAVDTPDQLDFLLSDKTSETTAASYERREQGEHVRLAIATLPENYRQVLELHYFDEMPVARIATLLNMSTGATKTRLHRARRRLLQHLKKSAHRPVTGLERGIQ